MRALLLAVALAAAPAAASPFGQALADTELDTMRGGIELPGGITAAIGIAIETRVNGQLAVRTQLTSTAPGVQVFAGGPAGPAGVAVATGAGMPQVNIVRNATGTTVNVIPAAAPTVINIGAAPATTGTPLTVTPNGPGVATALGTVTLSSQPGGIVTTLSGPDLAVQQLIGQATGAIVTNTADNRVIDTITTVNVRLQGEVLPGNIGAQLNALFGQVR